MIIKAVYALLASLGFGVLFNIKGKNLLFASLGGAITWFFYLLYLKVGNSNIVALFIASIAAGTYSEILARILKAPVTIFSVISIIPLVPGGGMYYTMLDIVQGNINNSLNTGLNTISSAGSISAGILLAASLTKVILFVSKTKKTSRNL